MQEGGLEEEASGFRIDKTNCANLWARRILKYELIFNTYDPLKILRGPANLTGGSSVEYSDRTIRNSPSLEEDKWARRREQWRPYLYTFVCWTFVRALFLFIIKTTKLLDLDNGDLGWLVSGFLAFLTADPYASLGEISIIIFLCTGTSNLVYLVLFPAYFNRKPMQMTALRFILDPNRERQRVDLLIGERLDAILSSIQFYRLNQLKDYAKCTANPLKFKIQLRSEAIYRSIALDQQEQRTFTARDCSSKLESLERNRKQLLRYKRQRWISRPNNYSCGTFKLIEWDMILLVIGLHSFNFIWLLALSGFLLYAATQNECEATVKTLYLCHPFKVFNWKELWFGAEFNMTLLYSFVSFTIHVVILFLMVHGQLIIVSCIKSELTTCLEYLRNKNYKTEWNLSHPEGGGAQNQLAKGLKDGEEDCLDELMLRTLIRLQLYQEDLRLGSKPISELLLGYFFIISVFGTVTLSAKEFTNTDLFIIRQQIIIYLWVLVNFWTVACAHIVARVLDYQRVCWSILAESSIGQQLCRTVTCSRNNGATHSCNDTYLSELWRRMIFKTNYNLRQFIVSPIGIDITYRRVLQLNFFLVSFYSLLNKRD